VTLQGNNGRVYIFATELPAGPRAVLGMNRTAIVLQWGVAVLVSGFICYWLTRYFTTPILQLREASQRLAAGDLSTRAATTIERRHDELGDLVRDFNAMASASRNSSHDNASSSPMYRMNSAHLWRD
jgi:two-component system sensor histidine kinase CpxA